ncbi:hypothetical protein AX15_007153 [Amanita polypyramis BW_CC]|nr:hypothetical protein AX15_007153 [Amanita polypyramis BW_CC]
MPYHTVAPRPILKHSNQSTPAPSPSPSHHAVHFPPSPALTRIFSAHSPAAYDRSPIVIAPNSCTLPERGCPGRTYYSADDYPCASPSSHFTGNAKSVHPRSFLRQCDIPPPLVPDLSSESEESDGFACPFPEPLNQCHLAYNANGLAVNITRHEGCSSYNVIDTTIDTATAMSFLPYPPSPLIRPSLDDEEARRSLLPSANSKSRRRRSSRERKYDSSRDLDRIRSEDVCSESQNNCGRRSKSSSRTKSSDRGLSICSSFSSLGLEDDGCLGGF